VPLSGSTPINGTGMNGAVAGLNQLRGLACAAELPAMLGSGVCIGSSSAAAGHAGGANTTIAPAVLRAQAHAIRLERLARRVRVRGFAAAVFDGTPGSIRSRDAANRSALASCAQRRSRSQWAHSVNGVAIRIMTAGKRAF